MSKLSFRARALDASKPMPIYLAEELPDLPDYSAINRAVPQMPSGMEKEEESEHHLQRAISGTGLIIPTPEVGEVSDLEFYERCYPPDYKVPKQHIHMQPLWEEQEAPEYDIDSEDERWLKQQRHTELTEWKFEQMMDKLEKSSGQTVVTLNEAKLLLERHDEMVTAVYDYWLNKRLNTQHPLILSVKTESRPGQSSNNPYLAFRRRTEKMQTRKNRKNDESSYEKMLKLRRDLARALTLLELVARRETAKRELVKLTAQLAERRYVAGDFANQLLPDPPPRPAYTCVPIAPSSFRAYSAPHYPPRAPPTPVDVPRQREKRPYKRRKVRLPAVGSVPGLREAGVCSSSEEESSRTEAPPPDDGPFAFRRKPGCYYEMPTTTLCGDPLDSDKATPDVLYDHELDERNRFTLTSLNHPAPRCIGFARRRLGRGGRVLLDRARSALDDLWPRLPFSFPASRHYRRERDEEVELETKAHRTPKEMTRDYHTGGKHPWRHAFRQHLARNPHLWIEPEVKMEIKQEFKEDLDKAFDNLGTSDNFEMKDELEQCVSVVNSARTIDCGVRENLQRVMRKRRWSGCSDASYESDESLHPVEKEFEKFITEVNKKWLHFRPKTPPPSPPSPSEPDDTIPIALDTPLAVELRTDPSDALGTFTTSEFSLGQLYGELEVDNSGASLDISGEDLLTDNFTELTPDQLDSILSETDLKELPDVDLTSSKKLSDSLLELADEKDPFLCRGQGSRGRAGPGARAPADRFGSTTILVSPLPREPMYVAAERVPPAPAPALAPTPAPAPAPATAPAPAPVPTSKIIVEEVNEVPQIKLEKKRKEDTIEEVQLPRGVQLKTVQTVHSPLKKHIITSAHRRPSDVTRPAASEGQPQILTVAVSDSLKVRLQNHLLSSQAGVLVQNGPFPPVAVAVPVAQARETTVHGYAVSSSSSPRRPPAPLLHLAPSALQHKPLQLSAALQPKQPPNHRAPNKLKVLHAHPLTHTQRTQLLAQNRSIAQLPAVVSLSPLQDAKTTNTALLKAAPGGVTQFFEIKSGQLGKGPHLVNVVRQPQPGKTTVSRLELNDAKKRQVVAFEAGAPLKGVAHRLSLSLDGRQIVRAAQGPQRHQIQLKNRTLQVSAPLARSATDPTTSIACIPSASKSASIPSSVVANLLQKNVTLPKGAQKIAISGPGGQPLSANVQAIAFTTHQLKARQPRHTPRPEMVETASVPAPSSSGEARVAPAGPPAPAPAPPPGANGQVRRRAADTLPMEVT